MAWQCEHKCDVSILLFFSSKVVIFNELLMYDHAYIYICLLGMYVVSGHVINIISISTIRKAQESVEFINDFNCIPLKCICW